jgi:hypothetical protein
MLSQHGSCPGRNCNDKLREYMSIEIFLYQPASFFQKRQKLQRLRYTPHDAPHYFYIVTLVCIFELDRQQLFTTSAGGEQASLSTGMLHIMIQHQNLRSVMRTECNRLALTSKACLGVLRPLYALEIYRISLLFCYLFSPRYNT